jgi:hypothetical protein
VKVLLLPAACLEILNYFVVGLLDSEERQGWGDFAVKKARIIE